jgi:Fe-S cluster biogenesis protein NfuA
VDRVLEEVRPYLIADGGNIEVVRIDQVARDIFLRLQGACGSCPSSTTTMKMGVERVLREKFTQLGSVEAVSDAPLSVDETGSPLTETAALERKLEEKLREILPAIRGLGASASIGGVSEEGVVKLVYQGPEKVKMGVVYALKGMQGVTDVHVV